MKKACISLVSLAALFLISASGTALAQEETAATAPEQTITMSDLGISDPGVLPTSPFYFFKEMGRGMQGFFTFNPVAKAELELKITNEKAAEIKKIAETKPEKTGAIQKALGNYQKSQENLRAKLENLKETSQNPKIDTLLNNLTDKVVKHEKLFDEISLKFKDQEGISNAIGNAMAGSENVIGEASKKDSPAQFSSRMEKVLLEGKDGDLKNIRSVEIIDRLSNKTTNTTKDSLERLREEFSKKSEQDIQNLVEKKGEKALKDAITNAPGNISAKSLIIEEIQKRTSENLSQALGKTIDGLQTSINEETNISDKARERIKHAEEMLQELEKKISESTTANVSASIATLLAGAKDHLANAKTAFADGKYGEAFGQARSAEVLARNALKFFEEEKPETENFSQRLKELEEKINIYKNLLEKQGFTAENNKDAHDLLNNAITHLGYAKENFTAGDLVKIKLHISHVKEFLSKLSRILEGKPAASTKAMPVQPMPAAASCSEIQRKITALKESLNSGKMEQAEFNSDYNEALRKLIVCQQAKNTAAPLSPAAVPTQAVCKIDQECESGTKPVLPKPILPTSPRPTTAEPIPVTEKAIVE